MVDLDLTKVPISYAISKIRKLGYFQSPAFEIVLPVKTLSDTTRVVLDKLY